MLGSNPRLLRRLHWQTDALTTRLGLIHNSARSHPVALPGLDAPAPGPAPPGSAHSASPPYLRHPLLKGQSHKHNTFTRLLTQVGFSLTNELKICWWENLCFILKPLPRPEVATMNDTWALTCKLRRTFPLKLTSDRHWGILASYRGENKEDGF